MHAQSILAFLALAVTALSAAIPAPNAADVVRKSEAEADGVDVTQIGDGY